MREIPILLTPAFAKGANRGYIDAALTPPPEPLTHDEVRARSMRLAPIHTAKGEQRAQWEQGYAYGWHRATARLDLPAGVRNLLVAGARG